MDDDLKPLESLLQKSWIWHGGWVDYGSRGEAGRIAHFRKTFALDAIPEDPFNLYISADTRYVLKVNGHRVGVGPTRGSDRIWYYDTYDVRAFLKAGDNEIQVRVLRYFYGMDAAAPFGRTWMPGVTVVADGIRTDASWECRVEEGTLFPTGIKDDIFLHIFERVTDSQSPWEPAKPYKFGLKSGEDSPWILAARMIPYPFETDIRLWLVRAAQGSPNIDWKPFLDGLPVNLPAGSTHRVELEAPHHLNAFMEWEWKGKGKMKVTYSEGYEGDREGYPSLRSKGNRRQPGKLVGPYDEVEISEHGHWDPFWYRTLRFIVLEVEAHTDLELSMKMRRTGYPLETLARWESDDEESLKMWEVSERTMQNCLFDGFSDCPFYEQLQYAMDTRSSSMFHYLLSGDDRLARQAIVAFQASQTAEGVLLSRYPARQDQLISGFSLFWIKMVQDHHLYFADDEFSKQFLPTIDRVLAFFDRRLNKLGVVGRLPRSHWKYIDWVTEWAAPGVERGAPVVGQESGIYSYFSMLYAWTLRAAATLLRQLKFRLSLAEEYDGRADAVVKAIQEHFWDGNYFTDSLATFGGKYSANAQIWGILCGASQDPKILENDFAQPSYVMRHYQLRAFAQTGVYEKYWMTAWQPWRRMLELEMSTWEEDALSQRSDCHAWGSLPIYEYTTEVAGLRPLEPGWKVILWAPRPTLFARVSCTLPLGRDRSRTATIEWDRGKGQASLTLTLPEPVRLIVDYKGTRQDKGLVSEAVLDL